MGIQDLRSRHDKRRYWRQIIPKHNSFKSERVTGELGIAKWEYKTSDLGTISADIGVYSGLAEGCGFG
ncbi:jg20177 [Pararge aegeria aegeria]|uniref:Jg20177 protein n=1 Tax=Pararge aegeria aegeria TaxID=348720 RepID=A0A8S4S4J7_9NEOP|nr:jg20177 [Pararge aegeria aegeria]